jgi:hypothetical protein
MPGAGSVLLMASSTARNSYRYGQGQSGGGTGIRAKGATALAALLRRAGPYTSPGPARHAATNVTASDALSLSTEQPRTGLPLPEQGLGRA